MGGAPHPPPAPNSITCFDACRSESRKTSENLDRGRLGGEVEQTRARQANQEAGQDLTSHNIPSVTVGGLHPPLDVDTHCRSEDSLAHANDAYPSLV